MKFICPCGNQIFDSTDFISYKAYIIADQDIEDMVKTFGSNEILNFETFRKYSRVVYQCNQCHRFILPHNEEVLTFSADKPQLSNKLLRSVEGENWKRHLRGRWLNGKGEVCWGFGVDDEGFETEFDTWEKVELKYFEVFNRLQSKNIIRDSFLSKDGKILHKWPEK